jgi:hypothetical protein
MIYTHYKDMLFMVNIKNQIFVKDKSYDFKDPSHVWYGDYQVMNFHTPIPMN